MINWYRLINKADFLETQLTSFEFDVNLVGYGETKVLVTKGVGVSLVFDDTMLPLNLNGKNPFRFETYAAYLDQNDDVWLGIYAED